MEALLPNTTSSKRESRLFSVGQNFILAATAATSIFHLGHSFGTETEQHWSNVMDYAIFDNPNFLNVDYPIDTHLTKKFLSSKNDESQNDAKFFSLAQKFSEDQIELDRDFMSVLNEVTFKVARKAPRKRRL